MTGSNLLQGYFPRVSDFTASLRAEAANWGVPVQPLINDFNDSILPLCFNSSKYRYRLTKLRETEGGWNNKMPHTMRRTPLAYAFLQNPDLVVEAFDGWEQDIKYWGLPDSFMPDRREKAPEASVVAQ